MYQCTLQLGKIFHFCYIQSLCASSFFNLASYRIASLTNFLNLFCSQSALVQNYINPIYNNILNCDLLSTCIANNCMNASIAQRVIFETENAVSLSRAFDCFSLLITYFLLTPIISHWICLCKTNHDRAFCSGRYDFRPNLILLSFITIT